MQYFGLGAVHFLWLGACRAASPPFEGVGPAHVFEALSDGGQGVGSCLRPVAPGSFEPVPDDAIAGAFRDAGSDRQGSQRIRSLSASQVRMQGPVAVRLQASLPGVQLLPDPLHPRLPLAPSADRALSMRTSAAQPVLSSAAPGLRVPAVAGLRRAVRLLAGRALDTPESRHVSLIERPSRKWARRISPILSTPSIPASLSRINGRAVARIIERGRP